MSWDAFWFKFAAVEARLGLRRTTVLIATLWMTWSATTWAFGFADRAMAAKLDAASLGAVALLIGALMAPLAFLQKAVFGQYLESKGGGDQPG